MDDPDGIADVSGNLPCLSAPRAAHSRRDGTQQKRVRASAFAEPVVAAAGDRGDHRVLAADVGRRGGHRGRQRAGRKILRAGGARCARQGL